MITDLSYLCRCVHLCTSTGFDISVDGMNVTVGSGQKHTNMSCASGEFTVEAPPTGERCFGIFNDRDGVLSCEQDSSAIDSLGKKKIVWIYVDSEDVDLSTKEIYRCLPGA